MSTPQFECINPDDFLLTPQGRVWTAERNRQAWIRNDQRPADERVPESAIRAVAGQFEGPSTMEGFATVHSVRSE